MAGETGRLSKTGRPEDGVAGGVEGQVNGESEKYVISPLNPQTV